MNLDDRHDPSHTTKVVDKWTGSGGGRYRKVVCQEDNCQWWKSEFLGDTPQRRLHEFEQ